MQNNPSILERIREEMRRFPRECAVRFGQQSLSYEELEQESRNIAAFLCQNGIGQGNVISILLDRSGPFLVAALGILRSGAAYQPLDETHPDDRIRYMVEKVHSPVILTDRLHEKQAKLAGVTVICVEDIKPQVADEAGALYWPHVGEDALFAVLYTSGTTGMPKACGITHGNLEALRGWYVGYYGLKHTSKVAEYASFVFDMSMEGLFLPLTVGAQVHILPEEVRYDLGQMERYLVEHAITHISLTTRLARAFVQQGPIDGLALEHLITGGEALSTVDAPEGFLLHNGYGPSECTLCVAVHTLQGSYPDKVPIGRPMPGIRFYVLDEAGQPVEKGETGELAVAGRQVLPGYLNAPEETKKAFRKNPFSDEAGYERLYRTGDLVRERSDGEYEYIGRADRQIKLRGFRIEPSEIEYVIQQYPGIGAAVVVAGEKGENRYLVCYYTAAAKVDDQALRSYVARTKPDYMVPALWLWVSKIPVNRNGKTDFARLPKPDFSLLQETYEPAKTVTEEKLAALYGEVLQLSRIGRTDSFVGLGGDSLLGMRLISRIREVFGIRMGMRDILENPVLGQLAAVIDRLAASSGTEDASLWSVVLNQDAKEDQRYPASRAQRRIFTAQQMGEEEDGVYLLPAQITIAAQIQPERVQEAVRAMLCAHDSMRTDFEMADGVLMARVHAGNAAWIAEAVRRSWREEAAMDGISMNETPLFRWNMIYDKKTGETVISFLWHHSISDGRSMELFCQEFCERLADPHVVLPVSGYSYGDFATWEERYLKTKEAVEKREQWKGELAGELPGFPLAADHNDETKHRIAGHRNERLSDELYEMVSDFSKAKGHTMYAVLLATFLLLLEQYAKHEDVLVGTVMDGRKEPETERMQGMFVNTLPIRFDAQKAGVSCFREMAQAVQQKVLAAYDGQEIALEDLAELVDGDSVRTSYGNLFFDVLFVMQDFDRSLPSVDGAETILTLPPSTAAMYPLTVEAEQRDGGLYIDFEYDQGIFAEASVYWFSRHYLTLLEQCVRFPEKGLDSLSMLDKQERGLLLGDFQKPYRADGSWTVPVRRDCQTVVEAIKEIVLEKPEQTAVVYPGEALTYRKLWERSAGVSRMLTEHAHVPHKEGRVAILAVRSLSMIVGICGILRHGAAYIPIAPEYPLERIRFILEDSRPHALLLCGLTLNKEQQELVAELGIPVVAISRSAEEADGSGELPDVYAAAKQMAYMIYTSGTTGRPKGVMVEHRQLMAMLRACASLYGLTGADRMLQFANFVFDQSVWDIFQSLVLGSTLCLISEEMVQDPQLLAAYCRQQSVTAASLTPGFLRLLAPDAFPTLRLLDVGGEAPEQGLLSKWSKGRAVYNTYGPTETTVNATSFPFDGQAFSKAYRPDAKVPIGRPLSGDRVYILHDSRLCGIGIWGELCIAGETVARGYWNRQEQTVAVFMEDPFGADRMYRSGDIARFLPNGNLEFLGRKDNQVKVRGFRIELEEIEEAIRSVAGIHEAAVLLWRDKQDEPQLCGYYVRDSKAAAMSGQRLQSLLRETLERRLPYYMVPAFLMELNNLPLTVNGKLDRASLPTPRWEEGTGEALEAAATEAEADCQRVWAAALGLDKVSVTIDFLRLGGDSIKAIRIVSELRELGYQVDTAMLMRSGTIRRLAAQLHRAGEMVYEEWDTVSPTPIIRTYFKAAMKRPAHYNQSALFKVQPGLPPKTVKRAIRLLVARHSMLRLIVEEERLRIQPQKEYEGRLSQELSDGDPYLPEFTVGSEEERLGITDRLQAAMDPWRGIVMKAAWFVQGQETLLFFAFHHLVIDEVSWDILLVDLTRLCEQMEKDAVCSDEALLEALPAKTASFGQWAMELARYPNSPLFEREEKRWRLVQGTLDGLADGQKKLLDRFKLSGGEPMATGFCYSQTSLPKALTADILTLADTYGQRMDAWLLSVLPQAVCRAADVSLQPLVVRMESHGRGRVGVPLETDRTIGWFTAVYPLVIGSEVNAREEPLAAVLSVAKSLADIPNAGLGYGLLFEELPFEGGLAFNYLGSGRSENEGLFVPSGLPCGAEIDPQNGDKGEIVINIRLTEDRFLVDYAFDAVYDEDRIDGIIRAYIEELVALTDRCLRQESGQGILRRLPTELAPAGFFAPADWEELQRNVPLSDVEAVLPLTPLQQGIFYHWLKDPAGGAYVLQDELVIAGKWDSSAFVTALEQLSKSYDALRAGFYYQRLSAPVQLFWKERRIGFRELSVADRAAFDETARQDAQRGFDLTEDVLMRVIACHIAGDPEVHCIVTKHHIIIDGWSDQIVTDALMACYRGLTGEAEPMAPVSAPGFLEVWLSQDDERERMAMQPWRAYLDGYEGSASIEPVPPAYAGGFSSDARLTLRLEELLVDRCRKLARSLGVTMSELFAVLWGILLQFENGQTDVVFAETVSGREDGSPGLGRTVGLLINSVPVRVKREPGTTGRELLRMRHEDHIRLLPYMRAALYDIQSLTSAGSSLTETLFVYENYPMNEEDGLQYRTLPLREQTNYDICLCVIDRGELELELSYDPKRYPRPVMEGLLERLADYGNQLVTAPDRKIADWNRIPDTQAALMVSEFAGAMHPYPHKTVGDLLYEKARAMSDKPALTFGGRWLTYAGLYESAGAFAARIGYEEGTERYIVLIADPGLAMIVAMYGILMTGSAYIPVSPDYPGERMTQIINDAEPAMAVVALEQTTERKKCAEKVSLVLEALRLPYMEAADFTKGYEGAADRVVSTPPRLGWEQLAARPAYVIYTSGTSGLPKGVVIQQDALSNMVFAHTEVCGSLERERQLLITSFVFDVSVWNIFQTIANGGTLCIAPRSLLKDPRALEDYAREQSITVLETTPGYLSVLSPERFPTMTLVSSAGDVVNERLFAAWRDRTKCLINAYGPTEATVLATIQTYRKGDPDPIPIGTPIPNKRIYILQGMRLCGIGQKGEICIGGLGLAREYLRRKELTREKFIANPFDEGMLYRTGDLGAYLPDGSILFYGRMDDQVKIRGYRIELPEIESHILAYNGIREAAVVRLFDQRQQPYLSAYIVADGPLDREGLHRFLADRLPDYMIPAYSIEVDALPLNANGKLDKKRLPVPLRQAQKEDEPPANLFEEKIARCFGSIMGTDGIGRHTSFFEAGANSIDVMKMVSALSEYHLRVEDVFANPTPSALGAVCMSGWKSAESRTPDATLMRDGDEGCAAIYCIPPSGGMSMCYLELLSVLNYPGRIYGLTDSKYSLFGGMPQEELFACEPRKSDLWGRTLEDYFAVLQKQWKDGDILMGYSQGGNAAHILASRLEESGFAVGRVIVLESAPDIEVHKEKQSLWEEDRDMLRSAAVAFFAGRNLPEVEIKTNSEEEPAVYRRRYLEKWLDSQVDIRTQAQRDAMLLLLYQSYLVYAVNVCHPLKPQKPIRAPIVSVALTDAKTGEDVWNSYTTGGSVSDWIQTKTDDHLIFLARYKEQIAGYLEEWLRKS